MTAGSRFGERYKLDPNVENQAGRGLDCQVVLDDPLCSRVHAILRFSNGQWLVRDNRSLNGTYVNDQKIDEAQLIEGSYLRLASTEFIFHQSNKAPLPEPTDTDDALDNVTQTIVLDKQMSIRDSNVLSLGAMSDPNRVKLLLLLHQLSIRLLGCTDPEEVVRVSLDLAKEVTGASLAGFLWVNDEGQLKPKLLLPDEHPTKIHLSDSLTQKVAQERKAVWMSSHQSGKITESLQHYADAICAPMLSDSNLLGAIHIYLTRGRFRHEHFEFIMSLASITAVALARAFREQLLATDYKRLRDKSAGYDELIGDSQPMRELKHKIERLGRTTGCVLIRGESGTGKELVARALHRTSTRADRAMLSVNCAAIPADLMESQLFGHKAGSFTSADRDHTGYFQQADGGTLFLDEAGEMTLEGQAKLLRILENHPFLPVGATQQIQVDVRVVAATNQDLQTYVRERKFREDLYYRLSVFELHIPPLRERGDDIGLLIDFFLDHFKHQHGRPQLNLSSAARSRLLGYHWPGNVRQLRNVMDSAVVLAEAAEIHETDLGLRDAGAPKAQQQLDSLNLEAWEQKLIQEALARTSGNVPEAAELLGIGRATLYRKVDKYGFKGT